MNVCRLGKIAVMVLGSLMASYNGFAAKLAPKVCPSMEELYQYQANMIFPYGFDQQQQSIKYFTVSTSNYSNWVLLVSPVLMKPGDDNRSIVKQMIQNLELAVPNPIEFTVLEEDSEDKFFDADHACVYKLKDQSEVNAIAFYMDNSDDSDFYSMNETKSKKIMKIMKHAMMK